ncbi:MAG: hypothetical protein KGV51_04315 [Moraxellaceae bacterium]|nr:hypothetical protein [Moraxellaceae bacterium]
MKKHTLLLSILLSPLLLTACQTTNGLAKQSPAMQGEKAKKELQTALDELLYKSFNYQTDINISIEKRKQALANATPQQLANSKDKEKHCDNSHDTAYVNLLKKAEKQGVDIEDSQFSAEKNRIRDDYLACKADYEKWRTAIEIEEYLPNYDNNHTAEDVQRTAFVDEFVLKPLDLQFSGTYQPLKGKFSVMPSVKYQTRNLLISQQLPIFVDFKKGELYVWADMLATINSQMIDEKLGTQWKNKWLKFSLNDGSLPKGFAKKFLKHYIQVTKKGYQQEKATGFSYLSAKQLQTQIPYLKDSYYKIIKKSSHIVQRNTGFEQEEKLNLMMEKEFLASLEKDYPELMYEMLNGKAEWNKKQYGKWLVASYLRMVQKDIKEHEDKTAHASGRKTVSMRYYGVNGGRLSWILANYDMINPKYPKEPTTINFLTTFSKADNKIFANLPVNARQPTAENTVDAKEYFAQLKQHYEQGNGTFMGKIIYNSYNDYIERAKKARAVLTHENEIETTKKEQTKGTTKIVTIEPKTKVKNGTESSICVLTSVSIEMMCEADSIDTNDSQAVTKCKKEQQEMQEAYRFYCQQ